MCGSNFQNLIYKSIKRSSFGDYGKRAEYHVAHLLNHYTPKGSEWDEIPQVFQISVMNFYCDESSIVG
jgi:hypothetical protein